MASGTLFGGKKIIKSVGIDMVRLDRYQGFSADLSGALSLLVSTIMGLPVSTTHAKTSAMVGCAFAENPRKVNLGIIKEMVLAWVFTFPGCGALGYVMTKLFLYIF
jgi:PiT family inorganic phosphate transporter